MLVSKVAWVTTFLGVMILDVDIGLYIGIGFSLIMVIFKTQRPRIEILGHIPNTELYLPLNICDHAYELNGIKIICYHESLYYANVENFKYQIIKAVGIVPSDVLMEIKNLSKKKKGNRKTSLTNNPNSVKFRIYK
jgi:MFS superfamily sulfate permease-like transporter